MQGHPSCWGFGWIEDIRAHQNHCIDEDKEAREKPIENPEERIVLLPPDHGKGQSRERRKKKENESGVKQKLAESSNGHQKMGNGRGKTNQKGSPPGEKGGKRTAGGVKKRIFSASVWNFLLSREEQAAPMRARKPPRIQTPSSQGEFPISAATRPAVVKGSMPMMLPTTRKVAESRPISRNSCMG